MKKLISKETIAEVQKAYNELAEKNLAQCKEYKFNNVEYFAIGFVTVVKHGTGCMLNLKPEANKAYMSDWRKDIGNILAHDFRKNSAQGKYFEFKTNMTKTLLRRISDDELKEFKEQGFDHLKLGDYFYTIIIHTGIDTPYLLSAMNVADEDIPEREEDPDDDYVYTEEPENVSVSLFE